MKPDRIIVAIIIIVCAIAVFFLPPTIFQVKSSSTENSYQSPPQIFAIPKKIEGAQPPPQISAISAVITDVKSGQVLYEKNSQERLLPASTTKLMTALVALEKCSLDDVVTVTTVENEPNVMGLETGDRLTVRALLNGLLIVSGNDAAFTLAYSCAESKASFIDEMNKKTIELGMKNTHFTNPAGYDSPAHFSTSSDLAKLGKIAVSNPIIAQIVSTKSTVVTDVTGNKVYYLENTNQLLKEVEGVEGIKTGQTEGSKEVLLTKTTRNGNTIITVVLGSEDRFSESKSLIEWAFKNHSWSLP